MLESRSFHRNSTSRIYSLTCVTKVSQPLGQKLQLQRWHGDRVFTHAHAPWHLHTLDVEKDWLGLWAESFQTGEWVGSQTRTVE